MNEILVVIPYLASAAQGRELELAIAGWRRHFMEDFLIVLTGEGLPHIDGDDIVLVESKRVPDVPGQYRQHLDYVSCLKKVRARFPESEGFIMVADDCYAVNDFDLADVKFQKCMSWNIYYDPQTPNTWRQDAIKTARALKELGYPTRDYTTHVPIWFEWEKLEELWDRFDMEHQSYVMEDLYFNFFFPSRIPYIIQPNANIKLTVNMLGGWRPTDFKNAERTKIWINNNPDGWSRALEEMLAEHYGL